MKSRYQLNILVIKNAKAGINHTTIPTPVEFTHEISGFQMEFDGVSGHLSFDSEGFRKDYTLDVLELSLDNEPTKVRYTLLYTCFP